MDQEANVEELYRELGATVELVARRIVKDEHIAQEVSQEVWLRVVRSIDNFRGDAAIATWVYRIALNRSATAAKNLRRQPSTLLADPVHRSHEDVVLDSIVLERALARLPPGMRTILLLHAVHGLTHPEIANRLQITVGTSKSQTSKARRRLRELCYTPVGAGAPTQRVTTRPAQPQQDRC